MDKQIDSQQLVKEVSELFRSRGFTVRRENLSRGYAFRVKSGECILRDQKLIFIDRRLAPEQQVSLLIELLADLNLHCISNEEFSDFSDGVAELISIHVPAFRSRKTLFAQTPAS